MKDVVMYAKNEIHETGDGLLEEFKIGFIKMWLTVTNEIHFIISLLLAAFLSGIGWYSHYDIVSFLVNLAILDVITKHISITILAYGQFSIPLYFKAWQEKHLTSRKFRVGFMVKLISYSIAFYIANKVQMITEFNTTFGSTLAYLVYSSILLAELSSLGENFRDMGVQWFSKIIDRIKELFQK